MYNNNKIRQRGCADENTGVLVKDKCSTVRQGGV